MIGNERLSLTYGQRAGMTKNALAQNLYKSMEKKEDLKTINISILKIKDSKTVEEKIA